MQCNTCGQDNPLGAHFCAKCGNALTTVVEQPLQVVESSLPSETAAVAVEPSEEARKEAVNERGKRQEQDESEKGKQIKNYSYFGLVVRVVIASVKRLRPITGGNSI